MSRANAALSLPPGDRDDVPVPPGADLVLDALGRKLAELAASYAQLEAARASGTYPALALLARRHLGLAQALVGLIDDAAR